MGSRANKFIVKALGSSKCTVSFTAQNPILIENSLF